MVIAVAVISSYWIFEGDSALAAYGIALTGMGMLTTTGIIVSMDSFGPISDNANGIFEMSGVLLEDKNPESQHIVHKLDAVGNTTKAVTKGFAIASAVVAAVSLFRSYVSDIQGLDPLLDIERLGIRVNLPEVFVGLLIGGAMPFLFSSIAIRAVSRAAFQVVEEVRRQFRTIPGIMEGTATPDYGRCVAISTAAAQRELITPGLIAILSPIIVGFFFGVGGLGGFLAGIILCGQLLAVMLSNAGGTWDNAKKAVESGAVRRQRQRRTQGRRHRRHRGRPVQGHGRPVTESSDQGDEPRGPPGRALARRPEQAERELGHCRRLGLHGSAARLHHDLEEGEQVLSSGPPPTFFGLQARRLSD
jgi:K(+)-stimulated pyrophosphate-energized sodium pump